MSGSHQGYNVIYDKRKYFFFNLYTFLAEFLLLKVISTRIHLHFSDFSPHCSRRGRRRPIKIRRKSMRKSSLLVVRVKLGKFALSVLLDSFLQPATHTVAKSFIKFYSRFKYQNPLGQRRVIYDKSKEQEKLI